MNGLHTIARVVLGLVFIIFGVIHLFNTAGFAGNVPAYIPGASAWVIITGIIFILGGLSITANKWTSIFANLLALQLLAFIVIVHAPKARTNMPSQIMLLKDIGLMAAALLAVRK